MSMKTIAKRMIVAILVIAWAPAFAQATDNPNPCDAGKICVKVPGVTEDCFSLCCGESNPTDPDTGKKECTCDDGYTCERIKGKKICLDSAQLETYKEYKAKVAAAAHRKRQATKLADLESKANELETVKGDVEKTRLAHLAMLQSQLTLLKSTESWARDELKKAGEILKDTNGATGDMLAKWLDLRDAIKDFEKYLTETLDPATNRAKTILNNQDTTKNHPEILSNSITELQDIDLTLSNLTSSLVATRDVVYKAEEEDLKADLKAKEEELRAVKAELKGPKPNEISVSGMLQVTDNDDQSSELPQDVRTAWARLQYRRHFQEDKAFRPFVGGNISSGTLPDAEGFIAFAIEAGLRFGNPHQAFFWQARAAGGVSVGLLSGSGVVPNFTAGTGPGIVFGNNGFVSLEAEYNLTTPSFYGDEWHMVALCLTAGVLF